MVKATVLDITGNWHQGETFTSHIQVHEPQVCTGITFFQQLKLAEGQYELKFQYDAALDQTPLFSLGECPKNFSGLKINDAVTPLQFVQQESSSIYVAQVGLTVTAQNACVRLHLHLNGTRTLRTWLSCPACCLEGPSPYTAIGAAAGEYAIVHGIPFLTPKICNNFFIPSIPEEETAGNLLHGGIINRWECGNRTVKAIHCLGMIHSYDIANGSWYSAKGDHGYGHFAGDRAGTLALCWTDGTKTEIPLIFGFNLWYSRPWDFVWAYENDPYTPGSGTKNFDDVMFSGDQQAPEIIARALHLTDGIRFMGAYSCNARFLFSVNLDHRVLQAVEIWGDSAMHGSPLISALTLESDTLEETNLPNVAGEATQIQPVDLEYIQEERYWPDVKQLQDLLYTRTDAAPVLRTPEVPDGYFGPQYCFCGPQEATYAATYLYYNGPECGSHIADTGTGCVSSTAKWALHHYTFGMGVWVDLPTLYDGISDWLSQYQEKQPGNLPGIGEAWSRGAGQLIREAVAFGYDKFVDAYVAWMDHALLHDVTPPHWTRIIGIPQQAGQPRLVDGIMETGNRENDGHGNCMWGRYLVWHSKDDSKAWNQTHWEATKAAVAWIQWQLDHAPTFPGNHKNVLYTESECAWGSYDFCSSYSCLHGIELSIRMAKQLEEYDTARCWQRLYERLANGILQELTDPSEYGPIWHTEQKTDWMDHAHKLQHIQLAPDGNTYTPLEDYGADNGFHGKFLSVDCNSYRYLMKEKNYNCLRMFGYGQGYMTQAALLLDQMEDAEKFLVELLRHCYLPRFGKWISPEGIILHPSNLFYIPVNGYRGQDSHLADSTKALRLMLGLDDNRESLLRLVPRFPSSWNYMQITDFPVKTVLGKQKIQYSYWRQEGEQRFVFGLEKAVPLEIRLGPIPKGVSIGSVLWNGIPVQAERIESGDSTWIWMRGLHGASGEIRILYD